MLKVNSHIAMRYVLDRTRCRQSSSNELVIRVKDCWLCDNEKFAVLFNARTQLFHHFCCSAKTPFLDYVKYDLGLKTWRDIVHALSHYGETTMLWEMERLPEGSSRVDVLKARLAELSSSVHHESRGLDLTHWSADWTTPAGKRILEYAHKRHVPEWFIESGRLGYFTRGPLYGRMCALVVENGRPVYVVGRGIHEGSVPKYLCCTPQQSDGIGSSDVVFNLDLVKPDGLCIINEGYLSALSSGEGGVAILGKVLSLTQARKIAHQKPGLVVHLREQGVPRQQVAQNCELLRIAGLYVRMADLTTGDPNDCPEQMEAVLHNSIEVDSTTRMLAMLQDIP